MVRAFLLMSAVGIAGGAGFSASLDRADNVETTQVAAPARTSPNVGSHFQTDTRTLEETTQHILAQLNLGHGAEIYPLASQSDDPTSAMSYVIEDVPDRAAIAPDPLAALVADALLAGHDEARIHYDVSSAALAGEVSVPEVLILADGRIDTKRLLDRTLAEAAIYLAR